MPRILIVDDNKVLLAVASASLTAAGYSVVSRDSPIGFTATLRDLQPDVALIDVSMPALRGTKLVELARSVRRRPEQAHVVLALYSAMDEAELAALARECGADGYIVKSYRPADLPKALDRMLAARKARREGAT